MQEGWQENEEKPGRARLAWALTGSGHDFMECLELMRGIGMMDVFLSKAAAEVIFMYTRDRKPFPDTIRLIRDTTASAAPVGRFYHGWYHTLVVAPATSNTVAKCVAGISDTLVTNVYAQAGKCRIPSIVYACDTRPVMDTMAPDGMVRLWPRRIDLENTERLRGFEATTVVESMAALEAAVAARLAMVGPAASPAP
ncbi:flavoprotein [Marinimicrococcus flavescens]|uniref:flavoprotein n=1 Tax=Marinimicrococcus flavescens TaxID=3031815 RepID=UPI00389904FC